MSLSMVVVVRMWTTFTIVVRMSDVLILLLPVHLARQIFLAVRIHIDFYRADAAAIDATNVQPRPDVQLRNCFFQQQLRHAGVDQGAQKHVAAHSGKTIEVGYAHPKPVTQKPEVSPRSAPGVPLRLFCCQNLNFHHREGINWRQTAAPRALCYNHYFPQQVRGTLVPTPRPPLGPANTRLFAQPLQSRTVENRD